MSKLLINPYDENDNKLDLYAVIAYNWEGKETENLGLNVISTVLFFDKTKANEYADIFAKQVNCNTIVVPY